MSEKTVFYDREQYQLQTLPMPTGSLKLKDGRVLRPILGYSTKEIARKQGDKVTARSILDSKGWRHEPTHLVVTASSDNTDKWGPLLHVSLSYPDHDPTWAEIKLIRYLFFPSDVDVIMVLPHEAHYVNVHPYCYHLWQSFTTWDLG